MLHSNLSTRPFYNERLVRVVLGVVALAALALTLFNVVQVTRLTAGNRALGQQVAEAERESSALREQARTILQSVNRDQLATVQASGQEANTLIDRRAFSWTELFNQFERTLPANVRIVAVRPQVDKQGRMLVEMQVVSRRVEDLDAFLDSLEQTGTFRSVLSRQDVAEDDGSLRSTLQGYYTSAATAPPAASEPAADASAAPPAPAGERGSAR